MPDFEVTDTISINEAAFLRKGVADSYVAKGKLPYAPHDLGIFLRDDQGRLVAGLTGETCWSWLYIAYLWVADALRNTDLGTRLMQRAEQEALRRGCHSAYVFTQTYGAPDFYQKLGYRQFMKLDNCPPGHEQLGFMKRLAA
jgi:GNAT superfamily N-acetyltransferase